MRTRSWTVAVMAVALLAAPGCARWRKKPPPAPPPAPAAPKPVAPAVPLSVPQTRVDLPPAQPLDPAAARAAEEPPVSGAPEAAPPPKPPRRPAASAGAPAAQPEPPPTPAQPAEERPRVQEILSAEEQRKILEQIAARKREINDTLQQAARRNLSADERALEERVRSFVQLADQAAARGDLRQADALADRALVIARELRGGR